MGKYGILRGKEGELTRDLKRTVIPLWKLGEKYGVSKQAVQAFQKRWGIKRSPRPKGHQIEKCPICQKLIEIGKRPYGQFISSHTIRKELGMRKRQRGKYLYHLRMVRGKELVNSKFGCLHSRRVEKAYQLYFTKCLPIRRIGLMAGLKNFQSIIRRHLVLGWEVPPSLYVYDGKERSRIQNEFRKRRVKDELKIKKR
ncbi:MAG: hypothetical protein ABSB22_04990 [Thermodesulfobacteriota bacterium]|jgi:hypothetical protein